VNEDEATSSAAALALKYVMQTTEGREGGVIFTYHFFSDLGSISSTFYEQLLRRYSFAKKIQSQAVIHKAFSYEKGALKMLTPA